MNTMSGSNGRRSVIVGAVLAVFLGLSFAPPAVAAGDANKAKGIVAQYCVECHEIPGYSKKKPLQAVKAPPFQRIADHPKVYTEKRLRTFLHKPHYPMQRFNFSAHDIDNLLAFIAGLRR